jgi:gliding motility-associated-like protein
MSKTKIVNLSSILTIFFQLLTFDCFAQDARQWATYYGGTAGTFSNSVATDASGNVYLAGYTQSTTNIASGGFQNTFGGGTYDVFLVKFNAAGNRLWATYYGGIGNDYYPCVTTDTAGNVYLAGFTQSTTNIASGGFQNTFGGGLTDAFLVKFDSAGNRLWATYYGGPSDEQGLNVATDVSGNVYVAGYTESTSGIAFGGFQNTIGGYIDAFLVKFDPAGNRLWATYYGGTGSDFGFSIDTDTLGNIYLAGYTSSLSGISSFGFQNMFGGGAYDAFLVKFDASGNRLWATYYGGNSSEECFSVATDAKSNVYIAGATSSTSGIASGGFQNAYGGGMDSFLGKFDATGNRLWATYYGGPQAEEIGYVATDVWCNVYLSGESYSNINIASCGFQDSLIGSENQYVVKFNSDGNRYCATYYGHAMLNDCEQAFIAIDWINGDIYLAGNTLDTVGIAFDGFQNTWGGGAYLVKLTSCSNNILNVTVSATDVICKGQCIGTATVAAEGGCPPYAYSWNTIPLQTNTTATNLCAGTYYVTVTDVDNNTVIDSVLIIEPPSFLSANAGNDITINIGDSAQLYGSGGISFAWIPATGLSCSDCSNPIASPLVTTSYVLVVTDSNGCTDTDNITVFVNYNCSDVFVPNIFTPNTDGHNDLECVRSKCIQTMIFAIYDRWGEKVFESNDQNKCWDGTYQGNPLNPAVYVYYLEAILYDGTEIRKKGNISLIR